MSSLFSDDKSHIPTEARKGGFIVNYYPELYSEIMDNFEDYYQTGYTVCGAQDPAVIHLNEEFGIIHPSLAKYKVVRIIDKYLNPWSSATLFEFSNDEVTDEEYNEYEKLLQEEES